MKHITQKIRIFSLLILMTGLSAEQFCSAQPLLLKCYDNQKDYSFMWWMKTIKTGNEIFAIKTSHYALSFDYPSLSIQDLSINKSDVSEDLVLRETNAESFPNNSPCELSFGLNMNGTMSWCKTTSENDDDCQLVETGKYFQRRFITNLPDLKGCDVYNSGLEISSWPDRLAFILKATPLRDLKNVGLETNLTFPKKYNVLLKNGNVKALKNPSDGSGFIILKSANATGIYISGTTVKVKLEKSALCPAGKELNAGIIIYPISDNIDSRIIEIAEQEDQPLVVTAEQIKPIGKTLNVQYDKDRGWHQINLRSDAIENDEPLANPNESNPSPRSNNLNNRMERVIFSVTNPSKNDKALRLNFAKGRLVPNGSEVFAVPGISAILRDMDGNPVGIPIQLSKNWHGGGRTGINSHYFRGTWYHGLSMVTIPANSTITLEYTSVNSLWGGVPAASHAQLCLIGWGSNQQWDESAIGAWGESITYEPDLDQAGAPVLDFRPLMLRSPSGEKWDWTGNMGGADFFNYTKTDGTRGWHSKIKTQYKRYSPNYTEVTYAGNMDDNSMDFEYTASVGRSDDLTRGIYKIKLNVLKNTTFNDFVVFQAAAPTYHYTKSNTLAWGNETGLKKQWTATIGGTSRYIMPKQVAEGETPWFSFTDSQFASTQANFIPANRGFVIRNWKARINGQDNTPPWFAEYNTSAGNHGDPSGLINIIPPDGCTYFLAGDYIEAVIEMFQIPKNKDDYYGPNQNLSTALSKKANSWEMVYREAMGNDLDVEVTSGGTLISSYPIKIESNTNSVFFSVIGGLGYVPLTITNVSSYENPELYQKVNGSWVKVNQEVHGNDFWQTEYNASTGKWDISYNVNLDTPNDARQTVEFKFGN